MKSKIAILLLSVILSSCTTSITYKSEPPGAIISYQDGSRTLGVAPVRLEYEWDKKYIAEGDCLRTKGVVAQWPDGSIATSGIIGLCEGQKAYTFTLWKPKGKRGTSRETATKSRDKPSTSRETAPRTIIIGDQLTSYYSCQLYLDSISVFPHKIALNFYAYNPMDYSKGKFSINAAIADNSSYVSISGITRAETYVVNRKLDFTVTTNPSVSILTVKTTCNGYADSFRIPLNTPSIQDAVSPYPGEEQQDIGPNRIRLTKVGGVYEIPVKLNGVLDINFIFDSGASDIVISPDVALTLFRTGTIEEKDLLPGKEYFFADGSSSESERFKLKSIKIGNRIIEGVPCAISNSIEAPMLLGQSVLERLGEYTFDYNEKLLIFK